ncbi:DoxX family protein [Massilia sp. IC2-477]|uniref:DoxX family protein n=1 Tax=Massilia sp. IC2-477 TaxID=2887198 RepID=UPI001D116E5B|nr:DoxX family protein [Massilia sp. IC2-477]MCC2957201.1 DoxX family protein [Massilia sp. IC2-477]
MTRYNLTPYAALLLRLALGSAWLSHAFLKLAAFCVPALGSFLALEGMPTPMAWPVALLELAGGALIILGLHGRIASLVLLPLLAGALVAHTGNGWFDNIPGGGWLYPAILMMATLLHARIGDGAAALSSSADTRRLRSAAIAACR